MPNNNKPKAQSKPANTQSRTVNVQNKSANVQNKPGSTQAKIAAGKVKVPMKAPSSIKAKPKADLLTRLLRYLLPLAVFLSIMAQSRFMAVVLAAIALVFSLGKAPLAMLRNRTTVLTLLVLLYAVFCLIAGLYSDFGSIAVKESAKILSALALFALLMARTEDGNGKQLLSIAAVVIGIISFLCIDASCFGFFTQVFALIMKLFMYECTISSMGYEQGVRITGIFGNANVSAGIIAIGILISLYLVKTAPTEKKRFSAFVWLGLNALGFMLSFSMGAIFAFVLACIMFIVAAGRGNRFSVFLLMIETALATLIFSFAAIPFLGTSGIRSVIPLLCSIICGPVIWGLDRILGNRLQKAIDGKGKTIGIACGAIIAVIVVYAIVAFNISTGARLSSGEKLSRAEYLNAGKYSVSAEYSGKATVLVYSQNEAQLMMHTNTVLYTGEPDGAEFTVPEDSRIVWFVVTTNDAASLEKIALSDGTTLKLSYPLLPKIAANRLQGLFANQNFVQRLVFFKDGIKLFEQSPIIGSGLGSVEGRLTSVQSFYYESDYIHNQFIQAADEMGLLGLAVFVMLLLSAILLLLKERKKPHEPFMFAALTASIVMMIAHSVTEVVWSTGMYQSVMFLIFAVLIISYGEPIKRFVGKASGYIPAVILLAVLLGFGTMISGNLKAADLRNNFKPADRADVISTMHKLASMDVYDNEFYKATYIQNALLSTNNVELSNASKYAGELRATNEYKACADVAMYYYLPKGMIDEMFDASRAAIRQEASNADAWNLQLDFYQQAISQLTEQQMGKYINGVMATLNYLDEYNKGRMEEIKITDKNQPFVDSIKELTASNASDENAFTAISKFAVKKANS